MSGPFVGRRDALRVLATAIEAAGSGDGRVVVVAGEPGIGKTRLVAEAVTGHEARWANCWQGDGAPAFWPWRQLLVTTPALFAASDEPDARFALFDAVADALASAAATRAPLVLVIDDLQWADTSSIRLLQFLARDRRCRDVVVIATVRERELGADGALHASIGDLGSLARHVHLDGLDDEDVETLARALAGEEVTLPPAALLQRRSGGNPLFVNELVAMLSRTRVASGVPMGVWAVVGRRLDELSPDAVAVLSVVAVIGAEFDLLVLERAAGAASSDVARALDEAVAVQLVRRDRSRPRFAFVHVLVQEVLYERLGLGTCNALHDHVATVLEESGGRVSEIAHHRLRAATGDDDTAAIEWAVRAAEQCFADLAYEDAADWYGRALGLVTSLDREGDLLIRRGEASVAAGDLPEAREAFRQAAVVARQRGDADQLARAALGLGSGRGGFEVPRNDALQISLLEEAAHVLRSTERGALRARVLARLGVALEPGGGQGARRKALTEEAIELARGTGDPSTLGYALAVHCDVSAGPDWSEARRDAASEVVALARQTGDRELELLGHRLRLVAHLELGEVAGADQDIAVFATVAEQLRQPQHLWYVPLWRGMRALMRGDVVEAARSEAVAGELGERAHSHNALALVSTQRWVRQRQEGRFAEAAADFEEVLGFGPGATPLVQGVDELRLRAVVAAHAGDVDATARLVAQWAATALGDRPFDSEWLPETAQLAQLAAEVGNGDVAEALFEQLSPYADRFCVEGIGAAFTGSVRWYLAVLAGALGRREEADRLRAAAVAAHRRVGLAVDPPAMTPGAAAPSPAPGDRAASFARSGSRSTHAASLVHEGATWAITFRGVTQRVADAKGVRDLALLLGRPDEEVHCLELAGGSDVGGGAGPMIDQQARRAYQDRIRELQEVIQDAREANDPYRAERAEDELDALVGQLAGAFGLGGRERTTGTAAERARSTVTSRLRAAIRKIGELQPELGRHLHNAVKTGTWCAYRPEPGIRWRVDGPTHPTL